MRYKCGKLEVVDGSRTIRELTFWVCGTNLSTYDLKEVVDGALELRVRVPVAQLLGHPLAQRLKSYLTDLGNTAFRVPSA